MANQTRRNMLKSISALSFAGATFSTSSAMVEPTPDERIQSAMAEIESALKEKYPDWAIQVCEPVHEKAMQYETGEFWNTSEVFVIAAYKEHPLRAKYGFSKEYLNG